MATIESIYSIYPGKYVPLINEEGMRDQWKHWGKENIIHPVTNVKEFPDFIKIEMEIPGVRREEIIVRADKNILCVYGEHNENEIDKQDILPGKEKEPGFAAFDQNIILPKNADTEFVSAEYKSGILCIHVPKTKKSAGKRTTKIIVY